MRHWAGWAALALVLAAVTALAFFPAAPPLPPAYVISMKGHPRRPRVRREFAGHPFTFVDAVDGRTVVDLVDPFNHTWLPGEMGCAASHMRLWRRLLRRQGPVLVFEDDAQLPRDWKDRVAAVLRDTRGDDSIDVVFLGHCADEKGAHYRGNLWRSTSPRCTHAYLATRGGVARLAQWARTARLALPIDEELMRLCFAGKLRCLSHWPALVGTTGDASTIR